MFFLNGEVLPRGSMRWCRRGVISPKKRVYFSTSFRQVWLPCSEPRDLIARCSSHIDGDAIPHRVERRQEKQGQDRCDEKASHHRIGHWPPKHFPGNRNQPENRR